MRSKTLKKLFSVSLIFALIFALNSTIFALEQSPEPEVSQPSAEYLDWLEYQEAVEKGLIDPEDIENFGYIPDPVDMSHLKNNPPVVNNNGAFLRVGTASSYNGSSSITSVKNQGSFGTCWAHAALGAAEANALKNSLGTFDLSEFHMAYFVYGDGRSGKSFTQNSSLSILNQGGNSTQSIALLSRLGGATSETTLPYPTSSSYSDPTGYPEDSSRYPRMVHLKEAYRLDEDNFDLIKNMVQNYGAVQISYYSGQTTATNAQANSPYSWRNGYYTYYNNTNATHNHAVLIVGWDDNFSRSNFSSTPSGDGAWLIKNSWGTNWGANGYFWMSYKQPISSPTVYVVEAADDTLKHYGYDDLGFGSYIGYGDKVALGANIFTAEGNETIKKVGFYTVDNNVSYEIYIYTGVTAGNPDSGTLAYTKTGGYAAYAGYHTEDVTSNVSVSNGDKFSVVIKFTLSASSSMTRPIPLEGYNGETPVTEPNVSFIKYPTNPTWDTSSNKNVCIKAFTVPASGSTGTAPSITTSSLAIGYVGTAYSATLAATGDTPITWSVPANSLPPGLTLNTSTGVISGTPTAIGAYGFTLTATNSAGSDTKNLTITIRAASSTGTAPIITTSSLANGTIGTAYNATLAATGDATITWSWVANSGSSLPAGLSLNPTTGAITGTPTTAGTYNFSITATNSAGSDTKSFTITISASSTPTPTPSNALEITTASLPDGKLKTAYSVTLTCNGTATNWSRAGGSFPPGLAISKTGVISGKPTKAGTYTFTIKAVNKTENATKTLTLKVTK